MIAYAESARHAAPNIGFEQSTSARRRCPLASRWSSASTSFTTSAPSTFVRRSLRRIERNGVWTVIEPNSRNPVHLAPPGADASRGARRGSFPAGPVRDAVGDAGLRIVERSTAFLVPGAVRHRAPHRRAPRSAAGTRSGARRQRRLPDLAGVAPRHELDRALDPESVAFATNHLSVDSRKRTLDALPTRRCAARSTPASPRERPRRSRRSRRARRTAFSARRRRRSASRARASTTIRPYPSRSDAVATHAARANAFSTSSCGSPPEERRPRRATSSRAASCSAFCRSGPSP